MFLRISIISNYLFKNSMYTPIIISLFLIGLLMTSLIVPFTNMDIFSNTAIAQEDFYYNDYVEYNSALDSNTDKIYSDNPDEENTYECQKGPLEGFFVSSVEFCKTEPINLRDSTEKSAIKLYTVIGNTTSIQ
jgi:hypothetical protein